MSATSSANDAANARTVDMKLEIVVVPVSDVDRAKRFYGRLGGRLDADFDNGDDWRVIQFTPPGSGCSRQTSPPLQRRRRASLDRLRPPVPSGQIDVASTSCGAGQQLVPQRNRWFADLYGAFPVK